MRRIEMPTGRRFGRLTVIQRGPNSSGGHARWQCKCDCGTTALVNGSALTRGHTQSCGCLQRDATIAARASNPPSGLRHGRSTRTFVSPEYRSWQHMNARCTNQNATGYSYYGGRGISVCDRWRNSFEAFLEDMGARPPGTSIDRINNDGNYEPGNCRWATRSEQQRNKRRHRTITSTVTVAP